MIKLEKTEVIGWEAAIRGMRNPMNSWKKSDSDYRPILCAKCDTCPTFANETWDDCNNCDVYKLTEEHKGFMIGPNDLDLMTRLRNAGTDHRKFMRMITVYVDITAPLYWWKEFDTYKVGTVANSCSTMHKIADKEFTLEDFSCEHLLDEPYHRNWITSATVDEDVTSPHKVWGTPLDILKFTIEMLNICRGNYLDEKNKEDWWQMIQLLPSSYNQKRTVMMNYEVLANIYKSRKDHKLDEWRDFCDWIRTLPYSNLITGSEKETEINDFIKKEFHVPKTVSDRFYNEIKQNMINPSLFNDRIPEDPISFTDQILKEMQNFTKEENKPNE